MLSASELKAEDLKKKGAYDKCVNERKVCKLYC